MSSSAAPISSEMMFAPVTAMSDFRVTAHPKLSELVRRTDSVIKKHNRAAAPALESAIAAALTALREHLAFAELMAGEPDSTGIEMLTVADEGKPGPSAPIDW